MTTSIDPAAHRLDRPVPVEVRVLDAATTLLTTPDGRHHTLPLGTGAVLRLLDGWASGQDSPLVSAELLRAAEPLRRQLERYGVLSPTSDDPPAGPATPANPAPELPTGSADLPAPGALLLVGEPAMCQVLAEAGWDAQMAQGSGRAAVSEAYASGRVLLACTRGPADGDLVDLDRWCHDMRVSWLPVELTRGVVVAGPLVTPGVGASFEDYLARRAATAYDHRAHRALRSPSITGDHGPDPAHLADVLRMAVATCAAGPGDVAVEARRAVPGGPPTLQCHPVLPLPGSATVHRTHPVEDLVDPLTGLVVRIRRVNHHPSMPASLVTAQCDVADVRAVSRWANNTLCQGSVFGDADLAARSAVGESVERYCGNILDTLPVTHASWAELRRRGVPALDPTELVLYSEKQYAAPGFPFVPLTRDTRIHWVPGHRLADQREILVPASLVYVNWYAAGYAGAPLTNFCAFAGIAAGPDRDFAVLSALEEVIERHATMVWWLAGQPLPGLIPTPRLTELWAGTDPRRQRHGLIHIDSDIAVPVVGGTVHDDLDELVNIGFSARHTAEAAAAKAWTEALTLQEGSRDLLRRDGLHWAVMASGELNGRAFKPYRADRAYLDDFRADMHDCDDLMVQQQVYLDPRARARTAHLIDPPSTRPLTGTPALAERSLPAYRAALEAAGYEAIVVDLTTPDVASTGMAVVRVLVPGTVGNAPAAFPFLGHGRVQEIACRLGWTAAPLAEEHLNYFPLPHA